MRFLRKYTLAITMAVIVLIMYFINKETGIKALNITLTNTKEMLSFLPPIFILVGLLDVWVPKETMIRFMGQDSGLKGIGIAFILGSAAAGPLYAAFPIAALLLRKGARLAYVLFFLGAWSSTKLPLLLYETASLGLKFTIIHVGVSIPAFIMIAFLIEKLTNKNSLESIYEKAKAL